MSTTEQQVVELWPRWADERSKPVPIDPQVWQRALRLSASYGYSPPDHAGMTRESVRWFVKALRTGAERLDTNADGPSAFFQDSKAREQLAALIRFCETAGWRGFTLQKRWRRAIERR